MFVSENDLASIVVPEAGVVTGTDRASDTETNATPIGRGESTRVTELPGPTPAVRTDRTGDNAPAIDFGTTSDER